MRSNFKPYFLIPDHIIMILHVAIAALSWLHKIVLPYVRIYSKQICYLPSNSGE